MKITVIGTGYVGLVSGTCFAEIGHTVTCVDIDENKVAMMRRGESPIFEPGLNDLLERNIKAERLTFSTGLESVKDSKSIFLAVGTPSGDDGSANLSYLFQAAEDVAKNISDDAIIVIKSTVPIGTCEKVKEIVAKSTDKKFHIVNNPEFLKEGSAIEDFMRPDRVVIGHNDQYAAEAMEELYGPLVKQGNPIYMMSNLSAEMTKYAANCFLATKISFINDIARLCDTLGADINEVRQGISSDRRIGSHFLYPGPGYGGSCFPKDVKALIYTAKENGHSLRVIESTEDVNDEQKLYMATKIKKHYGDDLSGKTFAFWGVAFKANTDDVRESPAIYMAKDLIDAGAKIRFFDPEGGPNFMRAIDEKYHASLEEVSNKYDCLSGCDAMVTVTEWREFSTPDFSEISSRLSEKVIFDARNLFKTEKVLDEGFSYYAIGKKI